MTPSSAGRPPFLADHIGSLLRPAALRQAFGLHARKQMTGDEFSAILDRCVREAVERQEEIGLAVVTDGEFRRGSYWSRFVDRTQGLEVRGASFKFRDDSGHELEFTAPYAIAPVRRTHPIALDEFLFLRSAARATPKITLPAPSTMHFFGFKDYAAPGAYRDLDPFLDDLAAVYRQEIADLAAAGCRYIQIDEVAIALLCDPAIRDAVKNEGHDPHVLADRYIDALNRCVAGCPTDVVIGVHVCRGNFKGHYLGRGGYDAIAERFFSRTNANHFLLEYDTPRAGDFAPLRFVPKNKGVVLGLISSKSPALEDVDTLRGSVAEAARYIDQDRLALSPQCGFASTAAGNPLTEDDQWAKLRLLVSAAQAIWT